MESETGRAIGTPCSGVEPDLGRGIGPDDAFRNYDVLALVSTAARIVFGLSLCSPTRRYFLPVYFQA